MTNQIYKTFTAQQNGPSSYPRIILVHGTLGNSNNFGILEKYLYNFDIVCYDRRGYGKSIHVDTTGNPLPVSVETHLGDLISIIGEAPSIVFGHSYGGSLALLAATLKPQNLLAVVAFEPPLPWLSQWANRVPYSENFELNDDPTWAMDRAEEFIKESVGTDVWLKMDEPTKNKRRSEGIVMISELKSLKEKGAKQDFSQITIPITVARSEQAPTRHQQAFDFLASSIPNIRTRIISNTGHAAHIVRPDAIADIITEITKNTSPLKTTE